MVAALGHFKCWSLIQELKEERLWNCVRRLNCL
jgi:hypothetical protein